MFQEIEEFVKTDPYTKAGLIRSWYASLSISQCLVYVLFVMRKAKCVFESMSEASARHTIVRCYLLLHYSKAAHYLSARAFLHMCVLHCRDLQPFNAVVGTEISSS